MTLPDGRHVFEHTIVRIEDGKIVRQVDVEARDWVGAMDDKNHRRLASWLKAYGRAWVTKDPRAAAELCSEEATYRETPGEPEVEAALG